MRVIFAAIFVFVSMQGTVGVISSYYPDNQWPWWSAIAIASSLFLSLGLSMFIFNAPGYKPTLSRKSLPEQIADLESRGKLLIQPYRAVRSFTVEEFEDEGSHYYIELDDGRVLYLNGQYLYGFEEITDDPDCNQQRSFPCTEFEVLRHKQAGYVIDIRCAGSVLEPEVVAPSFSKEQLRRGIPEDGDIIEDKTYESLKLEHLQA